MTWRALIFDHGAVGGDQLHHGRDEMIIGTGRQSQEMEPERRAVAVRLASGVRSGDLGSQLHVRVSRLPHRLHRRNQAKAES
jgi:hypothetical protein